MKAGVIVAMRREYDALKRSGIASATMSGIGKVNAAAAATEMILSDRPEHSAPIRTYGAANPIFPDRSKESRSAMTLTPDFWQRRSRSGRERAGSTAD